MLSPSPHHKTFPSLLNSCAILMKEKGVSVCFSTLIGKPEGKRPLGRLRCRWEDHIKMDHREIGLEGVCGLDACGSG
jgi:hypothetical protein